MKLHLLENPPPITLIIVGVEEIAHLKRIPNQEGIQVKVYSKRGTVLHKILKAGMVQLNISKS
jgi:hypothetical protein